MLQALGSFCLAASAAAFSRALRCSRRRTLPELKSTQPPIEETMITVPREGSAADRTVGSRHRVTKAKEKRERMEVVRAEMNLQTAGAGSGQMKIGFTSVKCLFPNRLTINESSSLFQWGSGMGEVTWSGRAVIEGATKGRCRYSVWSAAIEFG